MTKTKANPKAKNKRKHRFVVGYPMARQCVYGKEGWNSWIDPMTEIQALRHQKKMLFAGMVVYELVEAGRDRGD